MSVSAERQRFWGWLFLIVGCAVPAMGDGPRTVEQSLAGFRLPTGLAVELVAAEPEVVDPVAVRFDEAGRMWVAEMRDYPHGPKEGEKPRSRIKILEDRDRDGRFESGRVFADELLFVTGLQPWRGGVSATLAGEVAYLQDTDGDGRADLHETWYVGFAEKNSQLRANHPRLGLDGQVYVANGLRGGSIVNPRQAGSPTVSISGKDFRFDPQTSVYEAVTGAGQFGLTFDEFGNRFTCTNRNPLIHVVLEERYIRRNPDFAPTAVVYDSAAAGAGSRLYPISRAWTTSNLHARQFTAACGALVYHSSALPAEYHGNAFTCDPTGNLVHREVLSRAGATFEAQPARDGVEFMASADEWFRPVNLTQGLDGALYVVDMYRAVIEHPQFMPDELKERPDLLLGRDRGRIYRIKQAGLRLDAELAHPASTQRLVELLAHPDAWQRATAARILLERADAAAIEPLERTASESELARTRVRGLWALESQGALRDQVLVKTFSDPHARVREQAVLLSENRSSGSPELRRQLLKLADDPDIRVRFQLALSLSPAEDVAAVRALGAIGASPDLDVWLADAVAIAAGKRPAKTLEAVLTAASAAAKQNATPLHSLLATLLAMAAERDVDEASQALRFMIDLTATNHSDLRRRALRSLAQALEKRQTTVAKLATDVSPRIAREVGTVLAAAARLAQQAEQPEASRSEAIALVSYDPAFDPLLVELACTEPVTQLRVQAIGATGRRGDLEAWRRLLGNYRRESPAVQRAIANGTLSRAQLTRLLIEYIEAGTIQAVELDRLVVNQLLKHRDAEIRRRFSELVTDAIPDDRRRVLQEYRRALGLKADEHRGQQVFRKSCAACHRIGGIGVDVAPDISDSRTRQPEQLLVDILQPNRAVDGRYISYAAITTNGITLTGILENDTASSIKLRHPDGKETVLLRREIDELSSLGISLMPDGLEKDISLQDMADLIAFVKNWRYLDGRTPLAPREAAHE